MHSFIIQFSKFHSKKGKCFALIKIMCTIPWHGFNIKISKFSFKFIFTNKNNLLSFIYNVIFIRSASIQHPNIEYICESINLKHKIYNKFT